MKDLENKLNNLQKLIQKDLDGLKESLSKIKDDGYNNINFIECSDGSYKLVIDAKVYYTSVLEVKLNYRYTYPDNYNGEVLQRKVSSTNWLPIEDILKEKNII